MADESLTHRARTREHARATDAAGSSAPEVEALLALFQPGEADQIVERVLRVVSQHLPFDWAGLVQRDGEVGSLLSAWTRRSDGTCAPDAAAIAEPRGAFDPPPSMTEGALPGDWGQPLTRHLFEKGLRRLLHAPLGGRPGSETFLLLAQRSEAPFRARGTGLVATLAAPLGAALEFAGRERELERRVEERTRELAILYDVSRTIGTTHRFEEMLQLVTGAVRSLLDADVVAVLVDLPGLRDFSLHLARPASNEARAAAASVARRAFERLAGRPATEMGFVVHELDGYEPEAAVVPPRIGSHQEAPLMRKGEVVGALVAMAARGEAFAESRVRLLQTIAVQASLTLDRLRSLQEAEELRLQAIIESIPNGILMMDHESRVAFASPAARRALELLAPDAAANPSEGLRELGGVPVREIVRRVAADGAASATSEIRLDDPRRIFSLTVNPVERGSGQAPGVVLVISDVTEARMMEEQLLQSEKLSAIGEMISGVAHELNNPLAAVMGYAQLLQNARVREDVRRKLQIIYSESQRCQRVVHNLLTFARKHKPEKRLIDLNAALGSVLSLLSYQLHVDGIEVRASLDPSLPGVHGDFHLLQQVFLNIINNAHHAMRDAGSGGVLEVASIPPTLEGASGVPGMIRVEIRDTGPGISPENLKRIFDPFFTTKEAGQGTGLGLSLAYGTIKDHQGRIYARSQVGKGTTFVVELPLGVAEKADSVGLDVAPAPHAARAATILVIEDERSIAALLVEALSGEGHAVECASDGREALERIRARDFDLIISDLKMPHLDGRQLYEEVRRLKPVLASRIIFSTGDVASARTQSFFRETGAPFFVKPFDLDEVQETVNKFLTGGKV